MMEMERVVRYVPKREWRLTPKRLIAMSYNKLAGDIWRSYLPDIFSHGLRYVFENYLKERGLTEEGYERVARILVGRVSHLGWRMETDGRISGLLRYVWAGEVLRRYAHDIIQHGLLEAMKKAVPDIRLNLRPYRELADALERSGCIAKAFAGIVYDYAKIPRSKWPKDVARCYDIFVEYAKKYQGVRYGQTLGHSSQVKVTRLGEFKG